MISSLNENALLSTNQYIYIVVSLFFPYMIQIKPTYLVGHDYNPSYCTSFIFQKGNSDAYIFY